MHKNPLKNSVTFTISAKYTQLNEILHNVHIHTFPESLKILQNRFTDVIVVT